ncbi:hypothetical protein BJF85_20160 [Saccharomonospora sp. CUA-673]|nr:hypothetical protein BJF85_20160 [Saccharomonospora sp. CUA-673]
MTLVLDFLNTVDVEEDTDVLRSTADWHVWAHERTLRPDPLDEAARARHALRIATGAPEAATPEGADVRVPVDIALNAAWDASPQLVADTAVAAVYAAAVRLAFRGVWNRVKICPADDCLWAFYDESRNRSRSWCSMSVCGNRMKARTFRKRVAGDGDSASTHG